MILFDKTKNQKKERLQESKPNTRNVQMLILDFLSSLCDKHSFIHSFIHSFDVHDSFDA